ncbi:hypothetical protein [Cyanobium sp. LEGE 06113]|uniref:hypothetical protein n=1 Tax=Cyanobium sp. LEGE 06113 TaxID=1297573 RepID=UPI001882ABB8|nr:hypothetical protein [Cyanobium sp. LEGE 06113]MBE9153907.1 hypothetical protein [Cyanobium sp. LEGE 06113]
MHAVAKPRQAAVLLIGVGDTLRVKQGGTTSTVQLDVTTSDGQASAYGQALVKAVKTHLSRRFITKLPE